VPEFKLMKQIKTSLNFAKYFWVPVKSAKRQSPFSNTAASQNTAYLYRANLALNALGSDTRPLDRGLYSDPLTS
jgi:hypothetical protein